jgi:enoyl-[acyl-carrier protein] reductase/trans-2-enoyl-CoA reductase (NAD+)
MEVETFKKLPLGGVDRRSLVELLAAQGPRAARDLLEKRRPHIRSTGASIDSDAAVIVLGGSNGITRALTLQLVFGEGAHVVAVHYDSDKMQIGVHHAAAIGEAATREGRHCTFLNRDATRDKTIAEVIDRLRERYRYVHLINGIAAGATKRYAQHGPTLVRDLDVAFDPVLQIPDFGNPKAYRQVGWVEVEVATDAEIERTNKFMGTSSLLWVEPLAEAGLIARGKSLVAFCDYDFEADDPVYAMGPLAGAKLLQRETMQQIRERFGARTLRLCYPAMGTTALGAIPGGMIMYAVTTQILLERGAYRGIDELAEGSMRMWGMTESEGELRLDGAYQEVWPEFHKRKLELTQADLPSGFAKLFENAARIP